MPHVKPKDKIPLYSADNELRGWITLQRATRLAEDANDEAARRELAEVEDQVDHAAAELCGITEDELQEIRKALEILCGWCIRHAVWGRADPSPCSG